MSEERNRSTPKTGDAVSSFVGVLDQALKHFRDPVWLGKNSPLATPYLLHGYLPQNEETPEARGKALRQVLRLAAQEPDLTEHHRQLVVGYYVERRGEKYMLRIRSKISNPF